MSSKKNCGKKGLPKVADKTFYKHELISKDGYLISTTTTKKFYKLVETKKAEYNSSEDDDFFEPLKFAGKINLN
jgi:hypothetical protein